MNLTLIYTGDIYDESVRVFSNVFKSITQKNRIKVIKEKITPKVLSLALMRNHRDGDDFGSWCKGENWGIEGLNSVDSSDTLGKNMNSLILIGESDTDYLKILKLSVCCNRMGVKVSILSNTLVLRILSESTGGMYYRTEDVGDMILPVLIKIMVAQKRDAEKNMSYLPTYCECHNKEIGYGLTCPVCLAIYCNPVPLCRKCKIRLRITKSS